MDVVYFPHNCYEQSIFKFCTELDKYIDTDHLTIDFSRMKIIEPFAMAYIAKYIKHFKRRSIGTTIACRNYRDHGYAAHMGFFRAFGLKHGNQPGAARGSPQYIPLSTIRIQSIKDEASKEWTVEQEVIENKSEELAKILSRMDTGNLIDTLTFSIREIIRNVFEHSYSRSLSFCAQYWPACKKVEIAILDDGIGLRESLKKNPYIDISSDSDAIQQSLMPAISSKNYKGAKLNTNDPWHNSGFGLYMTSRICRLGGRFLICSGDHAILLDECGKHHIDLGHYYVGTAVQMSLNTTNLGELSQMLAQLRDEGYETAKRLKGVGIYDASAASQMLSRDFR